MTFSEEETKKLKAMFLFIIKRKHKESGGHGGFHVMELEPILEELEKDGEITLRRTINNDRYFLTLKKP